MCSCYSLYVFALMLLDLLEFVLKFMPKASVNKFQLLIRMNPKAQEKNSH